MKQEDIEQWPNDPINDTTGRRDYITKHQNQATTQNEQDSSI